VKALREWGVGADGSEKKVLGARVAEGFGHKLRKWLWSRALFWWLLGGKTAQKRAELTRF
jgi:hypothetical protein